MIIENINLRIFLKKFGVYEFLIVVEITQPTQEELSLFPLSTKKMDSWIHIDGVSQERVYMKEKGRLEHPVFKIKENCCVLIFFFIFDRCLHFYNLYY